MKKILGLCLALGLNTAGYSDSQPPGCAPKMTLDEVTFHVSAKQWVTTQTALLIVNVNATLNSGDLVQARAEILDKLNKIAAGEWHLTQFDRSQDSSGLEKLYVQAQARVKQESLTAVYKNAKSVSKPGMSYEIGSVEFKPSFEEIQSVKLSLREALYQQAREELERLNKVYTDQHYSVNEFIFFDGETPPQPKLFRANEMVAASGMIPASPPLTVSNEIVMTGLVKVASNRKPIN